LWRATAGTTIATLTYGSDERHFQSPDQETQVFQSSVHGEKLDHESRQERQAIHDKTEAHLILDRESNAMKIHRIHSRNIAIFPLSISDNGRYLDQ
jgi:hypothetical protein